ncbi:MAG: SHOCT domain-containing protein [Pseudonocardiales bacterium]
MAIGMIAFWGLLITGIVMFIRSTGGVAQQSHQRLASPTPEQLLAERFARGDIDEVEYTRRLDVLRGQVRT